ncbi:hypothetical protein PLICRDRAFT_70226, partial [Plicaturopsis crispa FD-325 SS-3]
DLAPHYALVKKDQATARKPLLSEADWFRVFSAWQLAVEGVYPHRSAELAGYQWIVISLFRQLPHDPHVAIAFRPRRPCEIYEKPPFSLDDRNQFTVPSL